MMNTMTIYTKPIAKFLEPEGMQRTQYALIEHKEETGMSDEQILRDIDRVLLQSNVKVYTPLRGDVGGFQEQILHAEMQGTRRSLTNFRKLDEHGKLRFVPRDPMRVLIIEMYLVAYYHLEKLKRSKLKNQSIVLQHRFQQPDA
jgi:hypothetical protein